MLRVLIPKSEYGKPLSRFLIENGYGIPMPCGGNGRCGNCRVKAVEGVFLNAKDGISPLEPDENGMIPACRALCPAEGGAVEIPANKGDGITAFYRAPQDEQPANSSADNNFAKNGSPDSDSVEYGLALDIGTTTLALQLVNLATGACVATASALNPQQAYGADVMTRIDACRKGLLSEMQRCLLGEIAAMIAVACRPAQVEGAGLPLVVAGNTVMLHIFLGVSPEGMASYPFTPAFTAMQHTQGSALGLPCGDITLLPASSAFIGGDITAGLAACGVAEAFCCHSDETVLFTDWGTNGETVLLANGKLYGASAAAGPAMEGGNICCGVGGVTGAVNGVFEGDDGKIYYTTVADDAPVGFCTAGLLDWIALLLKKGMIDESGFLHTDPLPFIGCRRVNGITVSTKPTGLCLTARDVREFQLAKSAIRSSADVLLAAANITESAVQRVYLAGGIGNYVSIESAVAVGLLPASWTKKTAVLGNSALAGAVGFLLHGEDAPLYRTVAEDIETVDLNDSAVFNKAFISNMMF